MYSMLIVGAVADLMHVLQCSVCNITQSEFPCSPSI